MTLIAASTCDAISILGPCGEDFELETNTSDPIYFTFYFDKTGSSTMRAMLGYYLPDDFVGNWKWGRTVTACALPEHPTLLSRYAQTRSGRRDGADWDSCAYVAPRPCYYVTVLRRPISRLVSAFNYFCLECAEEGRECGQQHPETLTCPDMAIHDYADVYRDMYVRSLSHHDQLENAAYLRYNSTEWDFDEAKRWILREQPYVLITEHYGEPYPFVGLGEFIQRPDAFTNVSELPHRNAQTAYSMVPPPELLKRLEDEYFYWDTKLYEWIVTEYVQPKPPRRTAKHADDAKE